ncbi:ABC transporter permease [Winogradskyella bathintestinalis]|uniref:ABC transporter permease n=1 Tax=Winogradskyella bathintestinalis TaxID=3035208 RepID=A0ABT7ZW97_9FLAO|nr:ABC transporter permease [Winogradskyella bathintestinalis]MDN3493244.1 ABC transporter permease [Winogradskyella bathintestinalis]
MKQLFKTFKVAFQAIYKNRTRSLLTMLGIIIGVAAVIMTISAGEGATKQVQDQISGLGTNLLIIQVKQERRGGISVRKGKELSKKDYEILRDNSVWLKKISPMVVAGGQAISNQGYKTTIVYGVSQDYFDIMSREVTLGEAFSELDVKLAKQVCLIGKTIQEELFGGENAIGKTIRIDKVPFTIVGLLEEQGQGGMGSDQDDMVVAPYTTVQNRLFGNANFNVFMASAISEDKIDDAEIEATILLREAHKILSDQEDDFDITTQVELNEITGEITDILTILLGAIASISLLVGGIGIMNIMLVSVTERTREIGTRLALGARESDILTQFLTEAIVLSAAGGIVGIAIGIVGNQIIYQATDFYIPTAGYAIAIGFGFSAVIGIAFGYFPARKAAKLNPIEALRYE